MTAAAVETRTPSEERIRFIGKKIADRLKKRGMSYKDLAADWGVSSGTARNAAYWPTPHAEPRPARIEELERAVDLPVGTLREQYYAARVDHAYWNDDDDAPELEPEPSKVVAKATPAKKKTTVATRKTTAVAVKAPKSSDTGPVITVDFEPDGADGPLRRRVMYLERLMVAMAPHWAQSMGVDPDQLLADMRLGS